MKRKGGVFRFSVTSYFLALFLIYPFTSPSHGWDTVKDQFFPEDIIERPPEVYTTYEFDDVIFTRENFYNKSAGMTQHRKAIRAPGKNLNFEVYNPADDPESVSVPDHPATETGIVEKDGKAVTVISIKEDSISDNVSE